MNPKEIFYLLKLLVAKAAPFETETDENEAFEIAKAIENKFKAILPELLSLRELQDEYLNVPDDMAYNAKQNVQTMLNYRNALKAEIREALVTYFEGKEDKCSWCGQQLGDRTHEACIEASKRSIIKG